MSSTKTPTSSLSGSFNAHCLGPRLFVLTITSYLVKIGFELLAKRAWYRSLAGIRRTSPVGAPPETSNTSPPPATKLPLEVVQMMIAHLIYDRRSLLVCSLTCYSWYIAAVPHLHNTLVATTCSWCSNQTLRWPKPLGNAHRLGLLPLVRKFQLHERPDYGEGGFSPRQFSCRVLRQWFGLTNVQELGLDNLEIPRFIPKIRRYFGHFLPTVRTLALRDPRGSRRQIIYFIGMFQHLQDLKLLYDWAEFQKEPVNDLTLIPTFVPPLRGRLTMTCFTRVGLLEDMIDLFRGIRFRHMDLFYVQGMRFLLDACAETLETLRLYPTDPLGE